MTTKTKGRCPTDGPPTNLVFEVWALYENGMPLRQISECFGIDAPALLRAAEYELATGW